MRYLAGLLLFLLIAVQSRLWLGEGGVLEARGLQQALASQHAENDRLKLRNDALEAEVRDLKGGLQAVEERARSELGMIRDGEVFYQVVEGE